jgi:excisionase family DNA binding protein
MNGPLFGTQVGHRPTFAETNSAKRKDENEMRNLTVIPEPGQQRDRPAARNPVRRIASRLAARHAFTSLIDAKAASKLLGVPYTWLLAQAREGKIPHHRLGHYVRFDPDDLQTWLKETRSGMPTAGQRHAQAVRDVA